MQRLSTSGSRDLACPAATPTLHPHRSPVSLVHPALVTSVYRTIDPPLAHAPHRPQASVILTGRGPGARPSPPLSPRSLMSFIRH